MKECCGKWVGSAVFQIHKCSGGRWNSISQTINPILIHFCPECGNPLEEKEWCKCGGNIRSGELVTCDECVADLQQQIEGLQDEKGELEEKLKERDREDIEC